MFTESRVAKRVAQRIDGRVHVAEEVAQREQVAGNGVREEGFVADDHWLIDWLIN